MADEDTEWSLDWADDERVVKPKSPPPLPEETVNPEDLDPKAFMEESGLVQEGADQDLSRPWMKAHKIELVLTKDRVRELVDRSLEIGRVALDLETEGFDNRIDYDENDVPSTRHKVVGYCLSLEGEGYYIPVRHRWNTTYNSDPNVDDVDAVETEIKRLCLAAQPVITEEGKKVDPLSSRDWAKPPEVCIEFWNAKFDQEFLYPITGIDWWHPDSFEDGMLANYVLYTDDDHGLKINAERKLEPVRDGEEEYPYEMIKFSDLFPKGLKKNQMFFYDLRPEATGNGWNAVLYGCSDAICTNLLCKLLVPKAKDKKFATTYRIEKQTASASRILERPRVQVDGGEIALLLVEAEKELGQYEEMIKKHARAVGLPDLNPGSPSQLAEFLFGSERLNLHPKPEKTATGQYKTDEKTLSHLFDLNPRAEVLGLIIKYRQVDKIRGTYLQNLRSNTDEHGQIRLNFKQTGAATGRFSAPKGEPSHGFGGVPIQGIPAREDPNKPKVAHSLRRAFIARPGYVMVKVDYASQEIRIAANISGEKKWIAEYKKELETGEPADPHYLTAKAFYPDLQRTDSDFKLKRAAGKTALFAIIYGGGVGAVQRATGCDEVEGARLLKSFWDSVPGFSKWVKKQHERVKKDLGVKTAFNRFLAIPDADITDRDIRDRIEQQAKKKGLEPPQVDRKVLRKQAGKERAACERKSTNWPIQGSGADVVKISLIMLVKELTLREWLRNGGDDSVRMVMTVHDEIVFEVKKERVAEAVPIIVKVMEYPTHLTKWEVPLIAEADLGSSWNAKLKWLNMLQGDPNHPVPDYLEGKQINRDPKLLCVANKVAKPVVEAVVSKDLPPTDSKSSNLVAEEVVAVQGPSRNDDDDSSTAVIELKKAPVQVGGKYKTYAVFTLGAAFVTQDTVFSLYAAVKASVAAAARSDKLDEVMPIEFQDDLGQTLYPAKKKLLGYPQDLVGRLRDINLSSRSEFEVLPMHHA